MKTTLKMKRPQDLQLYKRYLDKYEKRFKINKDKYKI